MGYISSACITTCLLVLCQVFKESKDQLALVLFGTDSTENRLSQDGMYQNIVVRRHLMIPDFELLEEIEHQIHPENQQADCILSDQHWGCVLFNEAKLK